MVIVIGWVYCYLYYLLDCLFVIELFFFLYWVVVWLPVVVEVYIVGAAPKMFCSWFRSEGVRGEPGSTAIHLCMWTCWNGG